MQERVTCRGRLPGSPAGVACLGRLPGSPARVTYHPLDPAPWAPAAEAGAQEAPGQVSRETVTGASLATGLGDPSPRGSAACPSICPSVCPSVRPSVAGRRLFLAVPAPGTDTSPWRSRPRPGGGAGRPHAARGAGVLSPTPRSATAGVTTSCRRW